MKKTTIFKSIFLLCGILMFNVNLWGQVKITEVMSSSGTGGTADWFELTNIGTTDVDIAGWNVDDNSYAFANSLALNGVTSIPAGKSVIFIESANPETDIPAFKTFWGSSMVNVSVGSYTGSGIGFGSGGDGTVVFKADGTEIDRVVFLAATAGISFYWSYKEDGTAVETSVVSVEGSNSGQISLKSTDVLGNIGSPGTAAVIKNVQIVRISEVMSNSGDGGTADWFELTNYGNSTADITGWKVDDNSFDFSKSLTLNGVTTIPAGKSVIFIESATPETDIPTFKTFWGASLENVSVGSYTGSGIGFSSGGDGTVIFKADGTEVNRVTFPAAGAGISFYCSYDIEGKIIDDTKVSAVGTINGTMVHQVTASSANALANIASPGSAIIYPISNNISNTKFQAWKKLGNKVIFESIPGNIQVYSLSGAKIAVYQPAKQITLDLKKGLYILKVDQNASKIMID